MYRHTLDMTSKYNKYKHYAYYLTLSVIIQHTSLVQPIVQGEFATMWKNLGLELGL